MGLKELNERVKALKAADKSLKHIDAQKLASQQLKAEASQETASKPAKKVAEFVSVDGNDPVFKHQGKISKSTALLSFQDADGKVYKGYCQEYLTDVGAHHIKAKKGERVWFTRDNVTIPNVTGFKQ